LWYALRMGMSYQDAMRQPVGRLRLLTAIQQVKCEGMRFADRREFDPEKDDLEELCPALFN
jgi:hypothetical protein